MKPVWIVDDDQAIRWVLEKALARAGVTTRSFSQAQDVLDALQTDMPATLVSDIRMPGGSGLDLLRQLKERHPALPVIVMTAFADLDSTVSAFQGGAFDYLAKPFDVNEAVALIQRAVQESTAPETERADPEAAESERWMMTQSSSTAMQEVFRAIGRLAQSKVTVLITGESGTGKELVARALHGHGARHTGPFVALNAAAIPRDLLEAELFGHERGAFTGANTLRRGRFEEAHGGTLFLDEIGDMPIELQTRLLRVLAEGNFYRVGGAQPVRVDVRIVAATHQPLEQRVEQGLFREDLFHRLNVIRLRLPPLRERTEDIPSLAQHFLTQSARSLGVPVKRLTNEAMVALSGFEFPGNVRQLENFCHWLTVMAAGQIVEPADLPPEIRVGGHAPIETTIRNTPATMAAQEHWHEGLLRDAQHRLDRGEPAIMATLTRQFERILLQSALDASRGRRVEAATRLGIGRNTITRKLRELGIEDE
ncbi:nitrogen regulation protein NR(I) [Alcaligenaceae bacterium A4P071]|nr:nitrogen regulation protein NR(I) [Alcaligenaceae bacterium B3P038]MDQ2149419.1 nitrogen regulation protein NR(I) [Alcaligenaceae bacterium C4P045]MDQ2183753.1 nitrogen regulation protein NR(I) [Alcaligenaceae bacterium A4P071]